MSTPAQIRASRRHHQRHYISRIRRERWVSVIDAHVPPDYLYLKSDILELLCSLPLKFCGGETRAYIAGTIIYLCHRDNHPIPTTSSIKTSMGYHWSEKFRGNKFYKKLTRHFRQLG